MPTSGSAANRLGRRGGEGQTLATFMRIEWVLLLPCDLGRGPPTRLGGITMHVASVVVGTHHERRREGMQADAGAERDEEEERTAAR